MKIVAATFAVAVLAGCVTPKQQTYYPAQRSSGPQEMQHYHKFIAKDSNSLPVAGAIVEADFGNGIKQECTTSVDGTCTIQRTVQRDPKYTYSLWFMSNAKYEIKKNGYYTKSGSSMNMFGTTGTAADSSASPIKENAVTLIRPVDYLTNEFANSKSDIALRNQALKFLDLMRLEAILTDADIATKSVGTSTFKNNKYFAMKVKSTTTYNSLKMDKYAIGRRLFDDTVRKVLNPLNDNISNPRSFFGYDLKVIGYTKSFGEKYAAPESIEYRFYMPQSAVKKYKDKDISGQQLLDASIILMNDERIDLKLQ